MNTTDIINFIIAFAMGVISSWAFWYLLVLTKPKIAISPMTAYNPDSGKLQIRIINRTRRQAADIHFSLFVAERGKWSYHTIFTPELNRNYLFALGSVKNFGKFWVLPTSSIFGTSDGKQILDLLSTSGDGERRLVLTLVATDALSGSKVIQRVAYGIEDIKHGKFSPGLEFQVFEDTKHQQREEDESEEEIPADT